MASTETFVADLAPVLRSRRYKGSGSTYRKLEGDTLFVVNFQRSRDGAHFFINLGGQPTQIPDEGNGYPNPKRLKEYECVFRARVGNEWPRTLSPQDLMTARAELARCLLAFEQKVSSASEKVRLEEAAELLEDLPFGCTASRAALHLARISKAVGEREKCRSYVQLGLKLAGSGATLLVAELKKLEGGAE